MRRAAALRALLTGLSLGLLACDRPQQTTDLTQTTGPEQDVQGQSQHIESRHIEADLSCSPGGGGAEGHPWWQDGDLTCLLTAPAGSTTPVQATARFSSAQGLQTRHWRAGPLPEDGDPVQPLEVMVADEMVFAYLDLSGLQPPRQTFTAEVRLDFGPDQPPLILLARGKPTQAP